MATSATTTTIAKPSSSWFSLFFSNSCGCDVSKCRSSCLEEEGPVALARKTKRTMSPPKTLAEVFYNAKSYSSEEEDEAHVKRGRRRRSQFKRRKPRKQVEKLSVEEGREDGADDASRRHAEHADDSDDEQGLCAADCACFSPFERKIIVRQDTPAEKRRRRKDSMKPLPHAWLEVKCCMPLTSSDSKAAIEHRRHFRQDVARLCNEGSTRFCRQDERGRTLLWIAAREEDEIAVAALFDAATYAFDPDTVHKWARLSDVDFGLTPAELAEKQGNPKIADLVRDKLDASIKIHALKNGWSSGPGVPVTGSSFLRTARKKTFGTTSKEQSKEENTKQPPLRAGSAPPLLKPLPGGSVLRSQTAPL